jgi:hypothetical protein
MLRRVGRSLTLLPLFLLLGGVACSSDEDKGSENGGRGGTEATGVAGASGGMPGTGGMPGVGGGGAYGGTGSAGQGQGGSAPQGSAHVHFVLKEVH